MKYIYDDPNTRILHQVLYSDAELRGYVIRPEKIPLLPFKEWTINKLVNINLMNLNKGVNGFRYLLILKNDDLPGVDLPHVGDILIGERTVEVSRNENFRNLEQMPMPIPVAQMPSYNPPLDPENHYQALNILPLYPADTFPYIPDSKYMEKALQKKNA